jgi:hypothetical protein
MTTPNMQDDDNDNLIPGKTIDYDDFFDDEAIDMQKLVDYYEGDQRDYVISMLDGAMNGFGKRKEWKHRGIVPRVRNVIKSIVDKSGLLFNKPPQLNIITGVNNEPVVDPVYQEMLENADWNEVMQNIDVYTRLCGSTIVLQQLSVPDGTTTQNGQYRFDYTRGDQLLFTILHYGNTVVKMNEARTKITELAYILDDISYDLDKGYSNRPKNWSYCVWTPEEIIEIQVNEQNDSRYSSNQQNIETVISREPNPYGIVPASFFYDTRKPRKDFWVRPSEDLIALQEVVNLALTDTEFAIAFQKQKTLFITGDLINDDNNAGDQLIPAAQLGNSPGGAIYNDIPFYQTRKQSMLGGLGSIAKLGLDGGGTAGKAEFVGPDTDLAALDTIITNYVQAVANDWSVNLNYGGGGKANSGFQLVVEELNNLQLRDMRAQMMQSSLRRFYEITKVIYPGQLTDGYLQAEFAPPNLPVNLMEQENIWTLRIDNNRASIKDYFMEEKGLTEQEADAKIAEVMEINAKTNVGLPSAVAPPKAPEPQTGTSTNGIPNA